MKTRSFFCPLIFMLIAQLLPAQEERTFHYGIHFTSKSTKQIFQNSENGTGEKLFGFSSGLDLFYDINERIQLVFGLNYSYTQINQIDYSLVGGCDIDPIGGIDQFNTWSADEFKIHYLGIPIGTRFKLVGQQNHIYLKAGIETLFKISTSSKSNLWECGTFSFELSNGPLAKPQSSLIKIQGGLGFEFKAAKKVKIYLEPQIEYTASKIFQEVGTVSSLNNNSRLLELGFLVGTRM